MGLNATNEEIMEVEAAIIRLANTKRANKNSYIHHETIGAPYLKPVKSIGRQYVQFRINRAKLEFLMSPFLRREGDKTSGMTLCQKHSNSN